MVVKCYLKISALTLLEFGCWKDNYYVMNIIGLIWVLIGWIVCGSFFQLISTYIIQLQVVKMSLFQKIKHVVLSWTTEQSKSLLLWHFLQFTQSWSKRNLDCKNSLSKLLFQTAIITMLITVVYTLQLLFISIALRTLTRLTSYLLPYLTLLHVSPSFDIEPKGNYNFNINHLDGNLYEKLKRAAWFEKCQPLLWAIKVGS